MQTGSVDVAREPAAAPTRLDDLYVRHAPRARALAYLLSGSRESAEDLVQEAFVRLIGRFRHLRQPEQFEAYLRRTVVNLHLSGLRRVRLERSFLRRHRAEPQATASIPDVGTREDLWTALGRLPMRQRAALVLRYYEDLSERETADVLGCSVAAAKSLVTRGLEGMRAVMEER